MRALVCPAILQEPPSKDPCAGQRRQSAAFKFSPFHGPNAAMLFGDCAASSRRVVMGQLWSGVAGVAESSTFVIGL